MQGSPEVIEFLNEALTAELTAINQYFAASKIAGNWGYDRLASKYHEESVEEMRDAEKLMERILLLDALPNMQRLGTVRYRFTRSRWGSCNAGGNISVSTRLLLTPQPVFDYVLIHELAHLVVFDHSPRFWRVVAAAAPDYRRHQAWLHRHHHDFPF